MPCTAMLTQASDSVLNVESEGINLIERPTGASACHILGLIILIERGMSREMSLKFGDFPCQME